MQKLCVIILFFALFIPLEALAGSFNFEAINHPEGFGIGAEDISKRGQIVGYWVDIGYATHSFLLEDGVFTSIDFPGAMQTCARGINDRGQIVGDWDEMHGFLLEDGVFTSIDFPEAIFTRAFGINKRGQIVGHWEDSDWDAHRGLGVAYIIEAKSSDEGINQDVKEKAIFHWRTSLQINPDQPRADRLRKLIAQYRTQ